MQHEGDERDPKRIPSEGSFVQPKQMLNENMKAEALRADRSTLFIITVLTGSHWGAAPGSE
jgi:hypothetical protein